MGRGGHSGRKKPATATKVRITKSKVREHFTNCVVPDEEGGPDRYGCICDECGQVFVQRNSTTLKSHLDAFHPEAFKSVQGESLKLSYSLVVNATFCRL